MYGNLRHFQVAVLYYNVVYLNITVIDDNNTGQELNSLCYQMAILMLDTTAIDGTLDQIQLWLQQAKVVADPMAPNFGHFWDSIEAIDNLIFQACWDLKTTQFDLEMV